ncbi:MAG TPA: hypothetical protein VIM54_06010 [Lacisediminihabitans sp.]
MDSRFADADSLEDASSCLDQVSAHGGICGQHRTEFSIATEFEQQSEADRLGIRPTGELVEEGGRKVYCISGGDLGWDGERVEIFLGVVS